MDADTVTTRPIPEVLEAIRNETGFVLGEIADQQLLSLAETSRKARPKVKPAAHIQTLTEAHMADAGLPLQSLYVRGCSGFTGFPRSTQMREQMLFFSSAMTDKFRGDWARWGTEQVTSNYLVANARGTSVLPFPKYGTPDVMNDATAFLHFIGSMRFINGKYQKTSHDVIRDLVASGS